MSAVWAIVLVVGARPSFKAVGPVLLGGRPCGMPGRAVGNSPPSVLAALVVTQVVGGDRALVLDARVSAPRVSASLCLRRSRGSGRPRGRARAALAPRRSSRSRRRPGGSRPDRVEGVRPSGRKGALWGSLACSPARARAKNPLKEPHDQGHRVRQPEGRRGEDDDHAEPRGRASRSKGTRARRRPRPAGQPDHEPGHGPGRGRALDVRRARPLAADRGGHPRAEVDIAVSSIDLAGAELALSSMIGRERALEKALLAVRRAGTTTS